ncbi:unnamed protein product [Auanema sp. JU1783]|nr:unnamed protein product [Auanema sp. JU1783]
MRLLFVAALISLYSCTWSKTSEERKLEYLITDQNREVDKFLTNAYIQIGTFMAETLFFVMPKYQDYINVVADIGARFLSLPEQVRNTVVEKFLRTGEINKTLDQMNGIITVSQEQVILTMFSSYDMVNDTEAAISFAKTEDLKLGNRLQKIYTEGKKQYFLSSHEAQEFVRKELAQLNNSVKRGRNQVDTQDVLKKAQKSFIKLSHEQKVEITKILLSAFNDILMKYFNELTDKLSQLHARLES